jgi:hypothetical protein
VLHVGSALSEEEDSLNGLNRLNGKEQEATPLLAENVKIERAFLSGSLSGR